MRRFRKDLSTHKCLLALLENGKKKQIAVKLLVICLLIYQKHLIVSTMNFPLQSLINMVSAYQHSNQLMIILIGNKQQESTFLFSE